MDVWKHNRCLWGFPRLRGTSLGVRVIVLGSILGSPYFGKLSYQALRKPCESIVQAVGYCRRDRSEETGQRLYKPFNSGFVE